MVQKQVQALKVKTLEIELFIRLRYSIKAKFEIRITIKIYV